METSRTDRLEQLREPLFVFFYAFVFTALVAAVCGAPGSALLLLVLGACAHVVRVGLEELIS